MTPSVVVDTNVFVAAGFRPASASGRLIEAVRRGAVCLLWSEATRRETESLLRKIPPLSWESVADLFLEPNRRSGTAEAGAFSMVVDPEDRKFAALAASCGATLISLDHHLLGAQLSESCTVKTPSEFLD